ncbi:PHD finger protein ING2-like isoform X2 [Bidens hawaiensis]|uniref:PHD finger protein ING2-like isoform X2 n=1 Tax=Bidens hawaiensis TaxID=980011 RepID=UPI0040493A9F
MAIARTGVFVDDYLEYASTLPAELQRLLNTIRELDDRSQSMINQTRQQTKNCLDIASQNYYTGNQEDADMDFEKMKRVIEANQDNALNLCTEKVLLARQAYDLVSFYKMLTLFGCLSPLIRVYYLTSLWHFKLFYIIRSYYHSMYLCVHFVMFLFYFFVFQIDSHVKRLDEDLHNFADDLKQEGKLPADEPAILPPLPLVPKIEKRKLPYFTPQSKKHDYKDRDFELMPPPGGFKQDYATPLEIDQTIDPNEPTYCVCHQVLNSVKMLIISKLCGLCHSVK